MEFLKIDGDTAKTKKTSFVAENSCKSGRGVLLHSSLFQCEESSSEQDFTCGELEKLFVAGFRKYLIARFHFSSQQGLLGVKTQQRVSIRSSFPFGHLN